MAIACEVEVNQLAFARIPVLRFPPLIFSDYVIHGARLLILSVLNPFQIAVKPADNSYKKLASYQVLAVEMESSALYTLAAKYKRNALSILTVSDHILTGEETSSEERQTTFNEMIEVALEAALNK